MPDARRRMPRARLRQTQSRPLAMASPSSHSRHARSRQEPRGGDYRSLRSVDEVTARNVRAIVKLEAAARANQSRGARIAGVIAGCCGTVKFAAGHALFFAAWIGFNAWPGVHHFDPYPFTFLMLVVSLEAIFLATFILISQNDEARLNERRNALDLQINLLTEQENTKMLRMLERLCDKLGVPLDDPTVSVLEQATHPDRLAEQIDRAAEREAR